MICKIFYSWQSDLPNAKKHGFIHTPYRVFFRELIEGTRNVRFTLSEGVLTTLQSRLFKTS